MLPSRLTPPPVCAPHAAAATPPQERSIVSLGGEGWGGCPKACWEQGGVHGSAWGEDLEGVEEGLEGWGRV